MKEKTKYFGIIVASEIFYYTFAEKYDALVCMAFTIFVKVAICLSVRLV